MEIYLVGGAIRDALLGLPVQDRDWVVVGATPEQMVERGFLPIGRDFPVFLHPESREEYALARTERKTAPGYRGFVIHAAPDVTLEQDLVRRDITINSIAYPLYKSGARSGFDSKNEQFRPDPALLIDPFGGQRDLAAKVLRHVSDAFREDPVRILRVARFAARFPDFSVAPETMVLMREMVSHGEADHLVAERVWQEIANGLMTPAPALMLAVLRDCGALSRLMPELDGSDPVAAALTHSVTHHTSLPIRFACLTHQVASQKMLTALCERLRVPTECKDLAELVWREQGVILASQGLDARRLVELLERCDAFRKPQRYADALVACECIQGWTESGHALRRRLLEVLREAQSVDTAAIAKGAQSSGITGPGIGDLIHQARVTAVTSGAAYRSATSASAP